MNANSFPDNALRDVGARGEMLESLQPLADEEVTPSGARRNARKQAQGPPDHMRNSQPHNDMRAMEERPTQAEFNKALAFNHLRRSRASNSDEKLRQNSKTSNMPSQLLRWFKFNLVGGIGIVVQFLTLYLMKSVVHLNYLFATAIAVEAAVVHNFVWHEQFTWADRLRSSRHHSMRRLVRFNLANGAVSVLGNLAVMKGIVAMGHTNYLLANGIAIALCSLANFLVGEEWVFATTEE